MPVSSRSKSHKQINHSSREYSYLDDDLKMKVMNDDDDDNDCRSSVLSVRVSNGCLISGEKRRIDVNVNRIDELSTPFKRRKEKVGGRSDDGEVVNVDDKNLKLKDLVKVVGDSKKGKKRFDNEYEINENMSERESKVHDQAKKRGREDNEWPIEEELRNIELEKELEKRMKRREGYKDKDTKSKDEMYKYRENGERVSKSREIKHRTASEKDNKHKGDKNREYGEQDRKREDKVRADGNRDYKYKEDVERDHRHKMDRSRDDTDGKKRSRDHPGEFGTKNLKDDSYRRTTYRSGSPIYDDRVARHKDNKDRRRDNNNSKKDEIADYRSRESGKRSGSDAKKESSSERGRASAHDDMEITANQSRQRSSSSAKVYPSRDHHRVSNQEEIARPNVNSKRDDKVSSRSLEKITQKADNCIDDLSVQKGPKSDARSSAISPASKGTEHKDVNGPDVRRNHDVEELNNRQQRSGSMGIGSKSQPNWNVFPNWPYPLANSGFIPFPHIPTPIFNPVMQQFGPPMFGRPPMDINHASMPFSGNANPFVWRNQVAESNLPPFHGWDSNNVAFGDGSHGYGNWDHGRTQLNNQIMETSADIESAAQKVDNSVHGPGPEPEPTDEIWSGQTGQHIENDEQSQPEILVETTNDTTEVVDVTKEDDTFISRVYLSKIDVSEDLTRPEVYDQCRSIFDLDEASVSDELDCKILFFEEGVDDDISKGHSLFSAIDDSVFKKAMSLYTKQKAQNVSAPDQQKSCLLDDAKLVEEALEVQKLDMVPVNEKISTLNKMDMEVDNPAENQDEECCAPSVGGCEVKDSCNNDDGSKEVDVPSGDGSLLVLTNVSSTELVELGLVNVSWIHDHSPESTH